MGDLSFKFFWCKSCSVSFRQRQTVIFHIVTYRAFNSVNAVHTACHTADHVDPVDILHTGAYDGAAVFLCKQVQFIRNSGRSCPWVDRFFTRSHHINASGNTFFKMGITVIHETEQCHYRDISVALIQNCIRIVSDCNAQLKAQFREFTDIHSDHFRIHVDRANNFRALLI